MERTGILWHRLEVEERRKREGRRQGCELDLEAERAPVSSPVWPPYRGAACARVCPPSFLSGLPPRETVAMSSLLPVVTLRFSVGWCPRLQSVSWKSLDLNPGPLTPSPVLILTAGYGGCWPQLESQLRHSPIMPWHCAWGAGAEGRASRVLSPDGWEGVGRSHVCCSLEGTPVLHREDKVGRKYGEGSVEPKEKQGECVKGTLVPSRVGSGGTQGSGWGAATAVVCAEPSGRWEVPVVPPTTEPQKSHFKIRVAMEVPSFSTCLWFDISADGGAPRGHPGTLLLTFWEHCTGTALCTRFFYLGKMLRCQV